MTTTAKITKTSIPRPWAQERMNSTDPQSDGEPEFELDVQNDPGLASF